MRVLLTGGAGFIGTALARRLSDEGHTVILYDTLRRNAVAESGLLERPNVTLIRGDVLDPSQLTLAAKGSNVIVHLASVAGPRDVLRDPVYTMRVGFQGAYNVLEAALATSDTLTRVLTFSSSEVCGRNAAGVDERLATIETGALRWTYAVAKLSSEFLTYAYFRQHGLPTVSVRPFNIYGPGQVGEGAVHHFITRALAGEPLVIHNDGRQVRAWCYVDDIVDAVLQMIQRPEAVGQVFNIGNPDSPISARELAHTIVELTGSSSELIYRTLGYVDVEVRVPSIARAISLLGWQPRVGLQEGLRRTVAWYAARHAAV